jgi:uncharacterized membrane protein
MLTAWGLGLVSCTFSIPNGDAAVERSSAIRWRMQRGSRAFVPNEAFAWRTIEGSPVAHAGLIRFEPASDGQTRVHIRMSYNPPGGWLGHGVAAAFGADPKRSLDADLVRMKTLIETGRPPHDAAQYGDRSSVGP